MTSSKTATVSAADPREWCLERRESSGQLVWRKDATKVRFRCDVDVLEYVKDEEEVQQKPSANIVLTTATCVAALAITILLPWLLLHS